MTQVCLGSKWKPALTLITRPDPLLKDRVAKLASTFPEGIDWQLYFVTLGPHKEEKARELIAEGGAFSEDFLVVEEVDLASTFPLKPALIVTNADFLEKAAAGRKGLFQLFLPKREEEKGITAIASVAFYYPFK